MFGQRPSELPHGLTITERHDRGQCSDLGRNNEYVININTVRI